MSSRQTGEQFMAQAIALSQQAVENGNEPFGAVLVKDGEVVFTNENQIYTMHDPHLPRRGRFGSAFLCRDRHHRSVRVHHVCQL